MLTFIKSQASSILASAADFLLTFLTAKVLGWFYLSGSILGTVCGGLVNFYINRDWVYDATSENLNRQLIRHFLVWFGNLVIVSCCLYLLTHFLGFNPLVSKIAISVVMGLSYNYYMQRHFIFPPK